MPRYTAWSSELRTPSRPTDRKSRVTDCRTVGKHRRPSQSDVAKITCIIRVGPTRRLGRGEFGPYDRCPSQTDRSTALRRDRKLSLSLCLACKRRSRARRRRRHQQHSRKRCGHETCYMNIYSLLLPSLITLHGISISICSFK